MRKDCINNSSGHYDTTGTHDGSLVDSRCRMYCIDKRQPRVQLLKFRDKC